MFSHVFARRASGLVREATLLDTILFGMMNNGAAEGILRGVMIYLDTKKKVKNFIFTSG